MLARITHLSILAVILGVPALAQLGSPAQRTGPKGYAVSDVDLLPGSPMTIFVAVRSELLRSTDGGITLDVTGFSSTEVIEDVAIAPNGTIYVASGEQILISTDGGASFAPTIPLLGASVVLETVEIHPTNPLELWIGYSETLTGGGGVLRSTNGGLTWSDASPAGWTGLCVAIAFDSQAPERILLVRYTNRAYLSTDGGVSWTDSTYVNAGDLGEDAAFVGSNIVISTSGRVLVTSDDGATWSTIPGSASAPPSFSIHSVSMVAPDPSTPGRAMMSSRQGLLFESLDSGLTWSPLAGPNLGVEAFILGSGQVALIGTPYGLLRRSLAGSYEYARLAPAAAGSARPLSVDDLSIDPTDSDRMAAVVRPMSTPSSHPYGPAIMTTSNGGATWSLDTAFYTAPISVEYGPNGALYAGRFDALVAGDASGSLQRLSPSGWEPVGPNSVPGHTVWCFDIEVAPSNPSLLFTVLASSVPASGQELGFWRSLDGGASWQQTQSTTFSITVGQPQIVVFGTNAGGEPRVAYLIRLDSGGFPGYESLQVSEDGGVTWNSRAAASYFDAETMNLDGGGANPGRLYLAKTSPIDPTPLQVSDDGGLSWQVHGDALIRSERVTASAREVDTLYLTSNGGAVRGTYSGASTERLTSITGSVRNARVASVPGGTLVAAFGPSGVWLKTIPLTTGFSYCGPSVPNSSGETAELRMEGTPSISSDNLTLVARRLPSNSTSMCVVGDAQAFVAQPGSSFGNLCLGGAIGRFTPQAGSSGADGTYTLPLDLTALPRPGGLTAALPGQTLYFQTWFRDAVSGTVGSNFTDAVAVTFTN